MAANFDAKVIKNDYLCCIFWSKKIDSLSNISYFVWLSMTHALIYLRPHA